MEKQNLPNATAVLILGILSIVGCCCYGIPGLIFGIIALVLAKKDKQLYVQNPESYLNYSNLNTGRILAIIGIVISVLYIVLYVGFIIAIGQEGLEQMQQEWINQLQNR